MKLIKLNYLLFVAAKDNYPFHLRVIFLLLILTLSLLFNIGAISISNPILATITSFITIFILPGLLLTYFLFDQQEISQVERAPISFVLGFGLLSLPALLLSMLQVNLITLNFISIGMNILLGSFYIFQSVKKANPIHIVQELKDNSFNIILVGISCLAILGVAYLYLATASTWSSGDNWSYLFYIRRYVDPPLPPHITPVPEMEAIYAREMFNSWWLLQAMMYKVAGTEPVDGYTFYLPPLLLVTSLLAFYSLAYQLFQKRNVALLTTLLQVVYCLSSIGSHEWIGRGFFDRIMEDKFLIWLIILPVATLLMLKYLSLGNKRVLLPLVLGIIALGLTHPMGLIQAGISWTGFAFIYLLFHWQRSTFIRLIFIFLPMLLLLIIPLAQRQLMATQAIEGAAFDYAGGVDIQFILSRTRLWVFSAVENSYMAHPHLVAHPLTLLAILLTPLLIQYLRQGVAAQFLFSNMAAPLLLLYNPFTAPLLGRLVTPWMLWRISWLLPVSLTICFFLDKIEGRVRQALSNRLFFIRWPHLLQLIPVFMVILIGVTLLGYIDNGLKLLYERKVQTMTEAERDLLLHLPEHVSPGSTIMAEAAINSYIPAFTSSAQVLTFRYLSRPGAPEDIDRFYRLSMVDQTMLDILKRWSIQYVIIKRQPGLAWQMSQLPALFSRHYHNAEYELYELLPHSALPPVVAGNSYLIRAEWDKAIIEFERVLTGDPDHALAHFGLGQVYQAQNRIAEAQTAYEQVLLIQPDNAAAHLALAGLHAAEGNISTATNHYQAVINLWPGYSEAHEGLGDLYLAQDRMAEAISQYEQAIGPPYKIGRYYLALGNLYRGKGLPEQARMAYHTGIALNPYSSTATQAYFNLALIDPGRLDPAMMTYQQTLALAPDYEPGYSYLANIYLAAGQSEKAIAVYQNAARYNLNSAWPHLRLGQIYLNQTNW